jgi:hypothetical protein
MSWRGVVACHRNAQHENETRASAQALRDGGSHDSPLSECALPGIFGRGLGRRIDGSSGKIRRSRPAILPRRDGL